MGSILLLETQKDTTKITLPNTKSVIEGLVHAASDDLFEIVKVGLDFEVMKVYFQSNKIKDFSVSRFLSSGFKGCLLLEILGNEDDRERMLEFILNISIKNNEHLKDRILSMSNDNPDRKTSFQNSYSRNNLLSSSLKEFYGHQCMICKEFILTDKFPYTESHHMTPLSEGGKDNARNIAILCPNCHVKAHKGSKEESEFIRRTFEQINPF